MFRCRADFFRALSVSAFEKVRLFLFLFLSTFLSLVLPIFSLVFWPQVRDPLRVAHCRVTAPAPSRTCTKLAPVAAIRFSVVTASTESSRLLWGLLHSPLPTMTPLIRSW